MHYRQSLIIHCSFHARFLPAFSRLPLPTSDAAAKLSKSTQSPLPSFLIKSLRDTHSSTLSSCSLITQTEQSASLLFFYVAKNWDKGQKKKMSPAVLESNTTVINMDSGMCKVTRSVGESYI